ncbi:hypothetical protein HMPREF9264_0241 [Lactobacillus delbrueckii subsp. bulgaricus PB2003/044-T3-4]|nr:hypothetical protein HMPREF9264_0241 [Lactobacillus delbrueckii subsp. bulgaricus PB2003/044-T3-4]
MVFNFSVKGKLMQGKMTTFMKKIVKIGKIARYPYKAKKRSFLGANC